MSELTKEYFDQTVKNFVTKQEFNNGLEELALLVNKGFFDIHERLDFSERVNNLETDMKKIKGALRLP